MDIKEKYLNYLKSKEEVEIEEDIRNSSKFKTFFILEECEDNYLKLFLKSIESIFNIYFSILAISILVVFFDNLFFEGIISEITELSFYNESVYSFCFVFTLWIKTFIVFFEFLFILPLYTIEYLLPNEVKDCSLNDKKLSLKNCINVISKDELVVLYSNLQQKYNGGFKVYEDDEYKEKYDNKRYEIETNINNEFIDFYDLCLEVFDISNVDKSLSDVMFLETLFIHQVNIVKIKEMSLMKENEIVIS